MSLRFKLLGRPEINRDGRQLEMAQISLEADTYRFDGSDMMPPEVGVGTFWQGIVDWVRGEDLETILQEIDASWPQEGEEG